MPKIIVKISKPSPSKGIVDQIRAITGQDFAEVKTALRTASVLVTATLFTPAHEECVPKLIEVLGVLRRNYIPFTLYSVDNDDRPEEIGELDLHEILAQGYPKAYFDGRYWDADDFRHAQACAAAGYTLPTRNRDWVLDPESWIAALTEAFRRAGKVKVS